MRNRRRYQRSNIEALNDAPAPLEPEGGTPVARIFKPDDLHLDDLAEAIRSLLSSVTPPQISENGSPNPDLLSFHRRGTHVVEERETP